ncbi:MAG TPA: helix-turn-helix domain-containing protein [Flavipsychrobacter sp.]|nr:helix-turn-helix domain-containing protein [Flavipsychrobacter sp.]
MNYAIAQSSYDNAAQHIQISDRNRLQQAGNLRSFLTPGIYGKPNKHPEQMLEVIAAATQMDHQLFKLKTRKREVVELRFLASLLLRKYYPGITLKQIAQLYGGQDHTSVMNGLARGNDLLDIKDPIFTYRYLNAMNAINQWIKN